jgi:hypothetical protein
VDKEIRHFRETGRADKVLALIIAGTPNSGDDATECFPPAFRETEPLAADLVLDGRTSALTRVAAGLTSVPFDALWQRQRRRERRQMALGAGLVGFGLMLTAAAALAGWFALEFQNQAEANAADAQLNLIEAQKQSEVAEQQSRLANEQGRLAESERERAGKQTILAEAFLERAQTQGALAEQRFAEAERGNANVIAREAKAIFADERGDHTTSILMALQADPSASRNALRFKFGGKTGYALARALMETGVANNRLRRIFTGHDDRVNAVVLTGDGRLVTGSEDGTARLWDLATGDEIRIFSGHDGPVNAVALTGDGRLVTGVGSNGYAGDNTAHL